MNKVSFKCRGRSLGNVKGKPTNFMVEEAEDMSTRRKAGSGEKEPGRELEEWKILF